MLDLKSLHLRYSRVLKLETAEINERRGMRNGLLFFARFPRFISDDRESSRESPILNRSFRRFLFVRSLANAYPLPEYDGPRLRHA